MAVYTDVSDEEVEAFLEDYDLGEALSLKGIAEGIENSNFLLTTTQGPFILTLYEKRVAPEELPFFLDLMRHLAERGVPCPTPVPGRDGRALRALARRPAAIVTFLPGLWPRRITPAHCEQLGAALAELHLAGTDFPGRRANALGLDGWREVLARTDRSAAERVQAGLYDGLAAELDHLAGHWPADLPTGVVHADLFPDNVFFRQGRVSGLIDFYFACTDLLAYDLAVCLNAWCFEPDLGFNVTKAKRLLKGYEGVRALDRAEVSALPALCRGAAVRFLVTRLYDWINTPEGALVTKKDPIEYWRRLVFHQAVRSPADYGLERAA